MYFSDIYIYTHTHTGFSRVLFMVDLCEEHRIYKQKRQFSGDPGVMPGTQVGYLVQEDPTCCGASEPVCHNY